MLRRRFLEGTAVVVGGMPMVAGRARAGIEPSKLINHDQLVANTLRETGEAILAGERSAREFSITAAQPIAKFYQWVKDRTGDLVPEEADHIFDIENLHENLNLSIKYFRPFYKFIEVIDGALTSKFPTYSLYRLLRYGASISSYGGIVLALKNIGEAATAIATTVAEQSKSAIADSQVKQFYFSSFLLVAELVFCVIPINFRFAWKGTRWVTNRLLFRLRRLPG